MLYILILYPLQVLLVNSLVGTEYEELMLDAGNAILPDTTISRFGDYIYVLTTKKVSEFFQNLNRPQWRNQQVVKEEGRNGYN